MVCLAVQQQVTGTRKVHVRSAPISSTRKRSAASACGAAAACGACKTGGGAAAVIIANTHWQRNGMEGEAITDHDDEDEDDGSQARCGRPTLARCLAHPAATGVLVVAVIMIVHGHTRSRRRGEVHDEEEGEVRGGAGVVAVWINRGACIMMMVMIVGGGRQIETRHASTTSTRHRGAAACHRMRAWHGRAALAGAVHTQGKASKGQAAGEQTASSGDGGAVRGWVARQGHGQAARRIGRAARGHRAAIIRCGRSTHHHGGGVRCPLLLLGGARARRVASAARYPHRRHPPTAMRHATSGTMQPTAARCHSCRTAAHDHGDHAAGGQRLRWRTKR